jgi:hypothetical protein
MKNFYIALIHYPVVDRRGDEVVSSVTNLDLHDLARSSRTYGVKGYYVVHPSPDQQALNRRIIKHWEGSYGTQMNPTRKEAFSCLRLVSFWKDVIEEVTREEGESPLVVGTSAKPVPTKKLDLEGLKGILQSRSVILVFGTAYGLSPLWQERLDAFLPPIYGPSAYNHLSVRSAVAIYLDRIFGH